jgi:hypothetical protein
MESVSRRSSTEAPEGRRRVIAHVVLFRPKATLTPPQRAAFITALEHALVNIPLVAHARVGRRVSLGRLYDQQNTQDFPFAAILEFESASDLRAYLEHPAHRTLGELFYQTAESALVLDFELLDGHRAHELLA